MSTMQSRTKHKFVFTITLHRVEGIRGLYDDDAVCIAWKRGTSSGRSKEAMMCNDLITWDETFEVAVSLHMVENTGNLSENSGKFEKKMLKFNLRQAASDERIADVEIDLSRYVGVACQVGSVPLTMRKRRAGDEEAILVLAVASRTAEKGRHAAEDDPADFGGSPSILTPIDTSGTSAGEDLHRLSKTVLSALVESLEEEHPEWTSTSEFHHPDLVLELESEVSQGLVAALVDNDDTSKVSGMTKNELTEHYSALMQLLNSADMIMPMGLLALQLDEQEAEEAAGGLVGYYDDGGASHTLLRAVVLYEIRTRGPSMDLFSESFQQEGEGSSRIPSVVCSFYIEALTEEYILDTLGPALEMARAQDGQMEVDANDSESASEGIVNAMHVIRRVMTLICDSINEVPDVLQYMAFLIHQTMVQLHPRQCKQVLCSFIVRRLFCPWLREPERLLPEEEEGETLSKQVCGVLRMAASCLEAMAGSEQLRTRESWVPEANAVIREFMRSLDVYAEDLIYAPDGYNTKIDRIDDALDMSTSLFIVNKLAVEHCQQLGNKMSLIVMSSEYLTGSTEEQARYIAECEQYDNQSEYGGDAWLADEQAMAATIQLEAREDSSLKSTVQAAQLYKKALSKIMKCISDWRIRDPSARQMYNSIEEEILASQEANRAVLGQLGHLQLYFDPESDYQTTDRTNTSRSRPCTPITDRTLCDGDDVGGSGSLTPLKLSQHRRSRPPTPVGGPSAWGQGRGSRPATPVGGQLTMSAGRSRPGTPLGVQVIDSVVDARTQLNDLIAVVNAIAEVYDIMRFSRMDTLLDADPSLSAERASEQSNSRLDHVITKSGQLSGFEVAFNDAIVVGNSLLEFVGDTAQVMQEVNNLRAALEAKRKSAMEEAGMADPDQTPRGGSTPVPETPREDSVLTPRTRVRRLSIGVANFVRQLSEVDGHNADGSLTHRGVEQNFYREPIGVKDKPPTDAEVEKCLNLLRDAHRLWRRLSKTSFDQLTKRESKKKQMDPERLLELSTEELNNVKGSIADLKRSWDAMLATGVPRIGYDLCFELLAEHSVLRLDLNAQQQELHRSTLERLRMLEQYTIRSDANTTTPTEEDKEESKGIGSMFGGLFG